MEKKKKKVEEKEYTCKECNCENEKKCSSDGKCDCNKKELTSANDKLLRLQAEYANYRMRSEKDFANRLKYEGESLILELLPIIDNFERAFKMDDNDLSDEVSLFLDGFKMIYASFQNLLVKYDIKEIDCLGQEFDPVYAQAVMVETDETKPANVILEVYTKGYMYKDKVIRPAMVKVNK